MTTSLSSSITKHVGNAFGSLAAVLLLSCTPNAPSDSGGGVPLRLTPSRVEAWTGEEEPGAWTLFDRDTTTRWSPVSGEGNEADLRLTFDAARTLSHIKIFGPATGQLDLTTEDGASIGAHIDLGTLRAGWNTIPVESREAVERVRLRVVEAEAVPDIEIWAYDAAVRPLLETSHLLEQVPSSGLTGQVDVLSMQPSRLLLVASPVEACRDLSFELRRSAKVYRRAWIAYDTASIFRPFVIARGLNNGPMNRGTWFRDNSAANAFIEPVDPARLVDGLNHFRICLPAEATGSVMLQGARFLGELDNGANLVEAVSIGAVGTAPTKPASSLLDSANTETQVVASDEHIVLAFERWTSPDVIVLAGDHDTWRAECLDGTGSASELPTEPLYREESVTLVVKPTESETLCAGIVLQPVGASAHVSFVAVAGSGARQRVDWPRIVLASQLEHFGRVAWVDGWASVPSSLAGNVHIDVNGVDTETTQGAFGQLLQRAETGTTAWPVTIRAEFTGGQRVTRQFLLDSYADPSGRIEASLSHRGTPLSEQESAARYGRQGQSVEGLVDPTRSTSIRLGTHVGVDVPAGATDGNVTVTIRHLEAMAVPPLDPGVINVTAPADQGFEFLPHGQTFRKPIQVLLPFDAALLPPGYTTEDIATFYFDESARRWKRLTRDAVDSANGTTRSLTDHFTVMINAIVVAPEHPEIADFDPNQISGLKAADPGARVNLISAPTANSRGDAALSYPIELTQGRAGLTPSLNLQYDSSRTNGWVGVGWELAVPNLTIETRWGAPRYDANTETETYLLNGEQLTPVAHRGPPRSRTEGTTTIGGETVKVFHARVEGSFSKIIRHGDHPSRYWWEVIDKQGVRFYFGGDPGSSGPASDSTLQTPSGNVFLWALREVRDPHGNAARYCSERVEHKGLVAGTVPGYELYLRTIDYTRDPGSAGSCDDQDRGPYTVRFLRDTDVGGAQRPDIMIDGRGGFKRVTAERLRRIELRFRGELVRAYELDYETGAFQKSLLKRIRQLGAGNVAFPGNVHELEYFDEVRRDPNDATVYSGFAPEHAWTTHEDDIDTGLVIPGEALDLFGSGKPSVFGGSVSSSAGMHLYVGFNPTSPTKQGSFGGKVGSNAASTTGIASLIDIDGDHLPDKVFRTSSGFVYRKNQSGPVGSTQFSNEVQPLPGLSNAISRETSSMFSAGVEAYPSIFGLLFNHAETFSLTSTYFSDANGDGLPDLVTNGNVLFNKRTADGHHQFAPTSTGTPLPIDMGTVNTSGLLPDYNDVRESNVDANPLVDTVRFWVAPFSGHVRITGGVRLTRQSPDGVRVAIQHNDSELWSTLIDGTDLTTKTPAGVSDVQVFVGDRIYFRVQSRDDGRNDEVVWGPSVHYLSSSVIDVNNLDVTSYSAPNDFILGGRPSINVIAPFQGTIRLQGTLRKLRVTSDGITVQLRVNGSVVFQQSLAYDAVSDIAIDRQLRVARNDKLELLVRADSPIDLRAVTFQPVAHLTYVSAVDENGHSVTVTNSHGEPIFNVAIPYDMDIYSVQLPIGVPQRWVAPETGTVTIRATARLPIVGQEPLAFTTKERLKLLRKHLFPVRFDGALQSFTFTLDVVEGHAYYLDFSSRDRAIGFGSFTNVTVDYGLGGFPVPRNIYTVTDPDLCSRPYRGWSYAGYKANREAAAAPIRHSGANAFCAVNADFDEDTTLPDNRDDLEHGVGDLNNGIVTQVFAPYPGGRNCAAGGSGCQIPAGPLWGGADELSYITADRMSSSRQGADDLGVPHDGDVAGVGASTVARLTRTTQDGLSISADVGPIGVSGSRSTADSFGEVDYLDLNGDSFPDVVSHAGVQYTNSRGRLGERLPVCTGVRASDSVSYNAGIGGTVSHARSNGDGRFAPTGSSYGETAANGSQMPPLGFTLSANGNIATSDVKADLIDINGDSLPDRLTTSDGKLWVEFNLGYGFTDAEQWDGSTTVNTGNGAELGGGASLGYNDGLYGWGGGLSVSTSTNRINEQISPFQRDGQTLADVNGDGLLDRIVAENGRLRVRLNTGAGFAAPIAFTGLISQKDASESKSTTASAGAYFTIAIPTCLAGCWLIINPGGDAGQTLQRQEVMLEDVDGDGHTDHVVSTSDGELRAALNQTGRTNLLRAVRRPLGSSFELEYTRSGNTFEQPDSHWVLSRLTVFDGLTGDGADYLVTSFAYAGGFFDRFEREFYGFHEVTETHHDTRGLSRNQLAAALPYRIVRREFSNDNFFDQGLLRREEMTDAAGNVFSSTENEYVLHEVDTGDDLTDPAQIHLTLSSVFPQLRRQLRSVSEGDATIAIATERRMTYDEFGNVTTLTDLGDVGAQDDHVASITYTGAAGGRHPSCLDQHIVGVPDSIVVRDASNRVLRKRESDIDCTIGDLTGLSQYIGAGATARSDFGYAPNGNLVTVLGPANYKGQRYTMNFTYDDDVQTHVKSIRDSFGYVSDAAYDLRYGERSSETDINGNTITTIYDGFGRVEMVVGPYEQGSGVATIRFAYHPEAAVPFARTSHFDRFRSLSDPIETILFTDGLKRMIQTKKDSTVFRGKNGDPVDVMIVSGRSKFDHVGRVAESYYPTEEFKDPTANDAFNATYDGVAPTRVSYDVRDRVTTTRYPDGTQTHNGYSIAPDRSGTPRFATTTTDALSNSKVVYRDARDLVLSLQEFNTSKAEVIWTAYTYDPMEQLVAIVDDKGNRTTLRYDRLGRRTLMDNADTGRVDVIYDNANNVLRKVTANLRDIGEAVSYEYDFTRLTGIQYPQFTENEVAYTYGGPELLGQPGNRVGRIVRITDDSGSLERTYGKLGEVTEERKTIASATQGTCHHCPETWTTQYLYDTWGRLQQMIYPDGEVLTYRYDSGGSVSAASGEKLGVRYPYVTRLEYDKFGHRAFIETGNGTKTEYAYDPTDLRLATLEAGTFQKLEYEYDDVGNLTKLTNAVAPALPNEMGGPVEQNFGYDSMYRLTSANGTFRYEPSKTDAYTLSLDYDTIHNIHRKTQNHTVQTHNNDPIPQRKTTYDSTYEYGSPQPHAPRRIGDFTFRYDANGNQLGWDDTTSGQRRTIVWDEENRIQSISDNGQTTTFTYDDKGERVIKRGAQGETAYINQFWTVRNRSVGTKHIFVGDSRLVSKLSPGDAHLGGDNGDVFSQVLGRWWEHRSQSGIDNGQNVDQNPHYGGQMPKQLPEDNFIYFYHPDHLGSSNYVTDPDGEVYEHLEYFAFGEPWVEENSNTERLPYLFTSKEIDQETDLTYHGSRYYDARTSVWLTPDPALWTFLDGAPVGGVFSSPNLSVYSYAWNSPLVFHDPSGSIVVLMGTNAKKVAQNKAQLDAILGTYGEVHSSKNDLGDTEFFFVSTDKQVSALADLAIKSPAKAQAAYDLIEMLNAHEVYGIQDITTGLEGSKSQRAEEDKLRAAPMPGETGTLAQRGGATTKTHASGFGGSIGTYPAGGLKRPILSLTIIDYTLLWGTTDAEGGGKTSMPPHVVLGHELIGHGLQRQFPISKTTPNGTEEYARAYENQFLRKPFGLKPRKMP